MVRKPEIVLGIVGSFFVAAAVGAIAYTNPAQMFYTADGTGAARRSVASKLGDVVSVKDFGAVGNATGINGDTDDTANFQAAVNYASSLGNNARLTAIGAYRLGQVALKANVVYDFRQAVFYPSAATSGTQLFDVTGQAHVTVLGGWCQSSASYTPQTTIPTGTYANMNCLLAKTGSTYLTIDGTRFDGFFTGVTVRDCNHCAIVNTVHVNGDAAIAGIATTGNMVDLKVNYNVVVGGGDDGIAVGTNGTGAAIFLDDVEIIGNRLDKTRIGATLAAVGIRVQDNGGSATPGTTRGFVVADNVLRDMVTNGIVVADASDGSVEHNTVYGFSKIQAPAILVGLQGTPTHPVTRVTFTGNTVFGGVTASYQGLVANYLTKSAILGNTMVGSLAGFGCLDLTDSSNNRVVANRLENTPGLGIRVANNTSTSDANLFLLNDTSVSAGNQFLGTNNSAMLTQATGAGTATFAGLELAQHFTSTNFFDGQIVFKRNALVYGATIAVNAQVGNEAVITATDGNAFTISNPTNGFAGQRITIRIRNTFGVLGVLTFGTAYKAAAWTQPANGFSRAIDFQYDGSNWIEVSRTPADVPN